MIVVYTSDLHGNRELYQELFALAEQRKAQAIIIGGDMLPIRGPLHHSLQEQQDFIFSYLKPVIERFLSRSPQATVYAMLGNDDWQVSNIHLNTLAQKGLLQLLHAVRHELGGGYDLIGYGHVPPTPFTIKDGERRDLQKDVVQQQRCTACLSQGSKIVVVDSAQYFASTTSIEEELEQLPRERNHGRVVYVMHSPPFKTNLDQLFNGRWVGSRAIRAFIEKRQPYLTLHGHIHESSEISSAYWDQIGKTICINPGQSNEEFYGVVFNLEDITGTIEHTVFGPMA